MKKFVKSLETLTATYSVYQTEDGQFLYAGEKCLNPDFPLPEIKVCDVKPLIEMHNMKIESKKEETRQETILRFAKMIHEEVSKEKGVDILFEHVKQPLCQFINKFCEDRPETNLFNLVRNYELYTKLSPEHKKRIWGHIKRDMGIDVETGLPIN